MMHYYIATTSFPIAATRVLPHPLTVHLREEVVFFMSSS